jgi:hypothetical protein
MEEQLAELLNNESNLKQPHVLKIKHISSPWQLDKVKDVFMKICDDRLVASKWVELHKTKTSGDDYEVAVTLSKDVAEGLAEELDNEFGLGCALLAWFSGFTLDLFESPIVEVKEAT